CKDQLKRQRLVGQIAKLITTEEPRSLARTRGECSDPKRPLRLSPLDTRDRQIIVKQRLPRVDVGPGDHLRTGAHEWLDRKSAFRDFERTVLGKQSSVAAAVDADDCPVRLLAREAAWKVAARRFARDSFEESIRRSAEGEIA